MAGVDKLVKALESLKIFPQENEAVTSTKKKPEALSVKDKVYNCNILAENIISAAVRSITDFPNFLGVVIETLLCYTNDKDADVRMVADDCLNRITKGLLDTNLGRLQVEFYKEVKRNGPSRCVRSALWRFAELAPLIRLQKRRAFVINLLPCVVKMAERHEEALQESLMAAMYNICPTLMKFATDAEIKAYLSPFINNLCSTSAVVRRVASTCATLVAQYSRTPLLFFNWLLLQVLDMVLPIMHIPSVDNVPIVLGCLQCIRLTISYLDELGVSHSKKVVHKDSPPLIKLDTCIMLFELIIHCLQQTHPSVTTAALECFQQLLKTPLPGFLDVVLTPGTMTSSVLAKCYEETLAARETSNTGNLNPEEISVGDTNSIAGLDEVQLKPPATDDTKTDTHVSSDDNYVLDIKVNSFNEHSVATEIEGDSSVGNTVYRVSPDSEAGLSSAIRQIGSLTDSMLPPLLYSVRLLCHSFLLTGCKENASEPLHPDRDVRVSIKSLALSCLSHIVYYYPHCMNQQLVLDSTEGGQMISDVLLYATHVDPQIQGTVAILLGNLLCSLLCLNQDEQKSELSNAVSYIDMLVKLSSHDNSVTVKLSLSALKRCLNLVLNSDLMEHGVRLVETAIKHTAHSYWLVKVELIELLSELEMMSLAWVVGDHIQSMLVDDVFISLLGDADPRVRQSASSALVRIVPKLYYPADHPLQNILLAKAKQQINDLIYPFHSDYPSECPPYVHGLAASCHQQNQHHSNDGLLVFQSGLNRIICTLLNLFAESSSQNEKIGICRALFELSVAYPVTSYPYAWNCAPTVSCMKSKTPTTPNSSSLRSLMVLDEKSLSSGGGALPLIVSLLTSGSLCLEISVHQDLLALAGNLLIGACLSSLKYGSKPAVEEKNWPGIYDRMLVPLADKLLVHMCRLLNIFTHVMEDNSPITTVNTKAVLDAAKEVITSPIKKRVEGKPDANMENSAEPKTVKEAEKVVKSRKEALGSFNNVPHYMRLYDCIKGAYLNYKVTLSLSKSDKFISMVNCILEALCQLLEVACLNDIGKCTEEILEYLKSIVSISPVSTITLVHQLLKALFGTNLSSQFEELVEKKVISRTAEVSAAESGVRMKPGLFTTCLSQPYAELAHSLSHNPFRNEADDFLNAIYVIKKCQERKMPTVLKPSSNVDKNVVGAYIRLFEPLVIKSLRSYTLTSSVQLQVQVLSLLVQLIQLRVNYCLLDNDEVFLKYVMKQIDMISEGPPNEQFGLIRSIFHLLLLLSYEKIHSKTLVIVPKIIQLCDGVMASGQDPATHALPALEMLVKDLFLTRSLNSVNTPDTAFHDIETQREVATTMLLRLITYEKALGLVSVILYQTMRENEDKWKKLSRQVIDLMLPLAAKRQLETETKEGLHALNNVLLAVSPSVYRPVDMLLQTLFSQPTNLENRIMYQRWMSNILSIVRVLLHIGKEEVILSRLNEMEVMFDTSHMMSSSVHMTESNESLINSSYGTLLPQEVLSSFLIQVISFCVGRLCSDVRCPHIDKSCYLFSMQQLSTLLLYTIYMVQSGHFRKIAKYMMDQLATENSVFLQIVLLINDQMRVISHHWPVLSVQWYNLLMLLNFNDHDWWHQLLQRTAEKDSSSATRTRNQQSLNREIIRCAGLAIYCDYVADNLNDAEHVTWLIVNNVNDLMEQLHETPVQDIIGAIYSNPSASGLFISALNSRYDLPQRSRTLRHLITCLRNVHKDQSGAVLLLLIEKLLNVSHSTISRMCESLACRRVEVLLSEPKEMVHKELSLEDMIKITLILKVHKHKHRRLMCLIEKLQAAFYPALVTTYSNEEANADRKLVADKQFYMHICRRACTDTHSPSSLCVSLLGSLNSDEVLSIMTSAGFQLKCLTECVRNGYNKCTRVDTGTVISNGYDLPNDAELSPLFTASEKMLSQLWMAQRSPMFSDLTESSSEFTISSKVEISLDLIEATCAYLQCTEKKMRLTADDMEAICEILVNGLNKIFETTEQTCSMAASNIEEDWFCKSAVIGSHLYKYLELLSHVLRIPPLKNVISANQLYTFSVIRSLDSILWCITNSFSCTNLAERSKRKDSTPYMDAELNEVSKRLVQYLIDGSLLSRTRCPSSLIELIKSAIIGVCRLQPTNRCARMPNDLLLADASDKSDLRADILQDTAVLQQFIKRNNLLGWISRQQFEETWAALLHLLSPVAVLGAESISQEEDVENIEWMVSALRGITGHLSQCLRYPEPGNTTYKSFLHVSRQKLLTAFHKTKMGNRLFKLRAYLERKSVSESYADDLLSYNLEKTDCSLSYNQLSVAFLTRKITQTTKADLVNDEGVITSDQTEMSPFSVDTESCLKLLVDVFSHLLAPSVHPRTPLMLLNECVKSILVLSDLFNEKAQFEWMFTTLMQFYSSQQNTDDDLSNQYALLGLCKAAALIELDSSNEEKLLKGIESSLRSLHVPTRLAAINGCLYLLESFVDSNLMKGVVATVTDFIFRTLDTINNKSAAVPEALALGFWSLTFYFLENYLSSVHSLPGLLQKAIQISIQYVSSNETNCTPQVCTAILCAYERLLLTSSLGPQEASSLMMLASDRLSLPSVQTPLSSVLSLLITGLYAELALNHPNKPSVSTDPDVTAHRMEIISLLFDRVRRGLPKEAELVTGILTPLMADLLSPQDIMNKVIGEFLTEQQSHPTYIARMIYEVFEQQQAVGGTSELLQNWILLSLTSFTQKKPLSTAIWCLNCCFVCASTNLWLKGLFPFLITRIGTLDKVDEDIFMLASEDFYNGLSLESQQKQFLATLQAASRLDGIYKTALKIISIDSLA